MTLDAPVAGPFLSYKPIRISGAVSDPAVSEIRFVLLHKDYSTENRYVVPVRNGKFSHTFFFSHEQAGDYRLQVGTKREGQQDYDPAGTFGAFTIEQGPETSPIPVDYFTDIVFSSPLPVEVFSGQAIRISGTVSDPSPDRHQIQFLARGHRRFRALQCAGDQRPIQQDGSFHSRPDRCVPVCDHPATGEARATRSHRMMFTPIVVTEGGRNGPDPRGFLRRSPTPRAYAG